MKDAIEGMVQSRARSGSWEAAARQTSTKRAALQRRIYEQLRVYAQGLTDEQLFVRLGGVGGVTPSGVRTRRNELERLGWVTELRDENGMPVKRKLLSGSKGQVWRAVRDGEPPIDIAMSAAEERRLKAHKRGMAAAEALAEWELGDSSIVFAIISAYLDPETAEAMLAEESSSGD